MEGVSATVNYPLTEAPITGTERKTEEEFLWLLHNPMTWFWFNVTF